MPGSPGACRRAASAPAEAKPIAAGQGAGAAAVAPGRGRRTVSPPSPTANSNGQFSLARQLGLGVSRIVLDAGHGGHDPGARGNGINEAELVLDVTLRLRDLLEKQPGIEVTLTRGTDEFIRSRSAPRSPTDRAPICSCRFTPTPAAIRKARGVETYFLNFASNPEAEAVAARENSASGKTMHSLPEIVRAIALNNKIDESRDFAEMVQKSMVRRLSTRNRALRDLGVKQAPFVVLIGAGMPSVLAEISFVTNKQDGALLKTGAYRQQIAESLFDAIAAVSAVAEGRDERWRRANCANRARQSTRKATLAPAECKELEFHLLSELTSPRELSVCKWRLSSLGRGRRGVTRSASESGTGSRLYFARSCLDPISSAAEQGAQQQRGEQHDAGQAERAEDDVADAGRLDGLLHDADDDDRLGGLHDRLDPFDGRVPTSALQAGSPTPTPRS